MTTEQQVFHVGEATITQVRDLVLDGFAPDHLLPSWVQPEDHKRPVAGETVALSVHTWVVRDRGRVILVDTGSGNDKDRPYFKQIDHLQVPFLDRLREAGVSPEAVDHVLLTHLHVDHVGWNTRSVEGRWLPTFPNARYVFARAEHQFFTDPANHTDRNRTSFQAQIDSVDPVIAAGLADQIDVDGSEVLEGIAFHPTPGHSPCHASISLRSGEAIALFAGDVAHHPMQVSRPDWNSMFDADPEQSIRSRKWALEFAADRQAMVFSGHFMGSGAGRVVRAGEGFAWQCEDGAVPSETA